jgi:CheY-like chemotaxis protein
MKESLQEENLVLVVEDNKAILALLKLALQEYGFKSILVASGEEAIHVFQQQQDRITLVLMDVQMPGLDGRETLDALRKIDPAIRCCFMSGHPGKHNITDLQEMGAFFIWKPFRLSELAVLLRELAEPD